MLIFTTLVSALAAPPTAYDLATSGYNYTYEAFVRDFRGPQEALDETRRSTFEKNLRRIQEHNEATPRSSWRAGVNRFTDLTAAEFRNAVLLPARPAYTGRSPAEAEFASRELEAHVPLSALPESVDWRTKGVVTPVKNQAACGSCWAFSTAETIESHLAIKTGKLLTLSEQQFVSCMPNPQKCGGTGGCQGATQWLGFAYAEMGVTTEQSYPYKGTTGTCEKDKVVPVANVSGLVRLPANNYSALMNAVANIGPIAISAAAEPWQMYESGIYDGKCGTDVDHAIQLVGYGSGSSSGQCDVETKKPCGGGDSTKEQCEKEGCCFEHHVFGKSECFHKSASSGTDYWLVRNSWGGSWGEKGYIRIRRFGEESSGEPCATDTKPGDGTGCAGGPSTTNVCGLCGILSDSSYPTGGTIFS